MQLQNKNRISYYESLRGIFALLVVLTHAMQRWLICVLPYYKEIYPLTNGAIYVAGFFVLSGFVLSLKYVDKPLTINPLSFAVKRFIRLYLVLVFGVIFGLTLFFVFHQNHPKFYHFWFKIDKDTIVQDSLWQIVSFSNQFDICSQGWTIPIEILYSCLIPALLYFGSKSKQNLILGSVLIYFFFPGFIWIIHFSLGVALAFHYKNKPFKYSYLLGCTLFVVPFIYETLIPIYYKFNIYVYNTLFPSNNPLDAVMPPALNFQFYSLVGAIASTLVIWNVYHSKISQNILNFAPLKFLGYISFSLYITHLQIIESLNCFENYFFTLAFSTALCIIVAYLVRITVEEFSIYLAKIAENKVEKIS